MPGASSSRQRDERNGLYTFCDNERSTRVTVWNIFWGFFCWWPAVFQQPVSTYRPRSTLLFNYFLAIVSGVLWYGQWFSFGTGATKLGQYSYAGWSIFMAAIIIFQAGDGSHGAMPATEFCSWSTRGLPASTPIIPPGKVM